MNINSENKVVLNDKIIRKGLISHLEQMSKSPKAILEELRVHNGNAIADVVSIHSNAHCYEIKGENDNIYRAIKQGKFYDYAFKKNTLVTTEKSIKTAEKLMPVHWGLMVAKLQKNELSISYVRKATRNPNFDKKLALLTLWKSELLDANFPLQKKSSNYLNRLQLVELIANELNEQNLLNFIGLKLFERNVNQEKMSAYR